MPVIYNLDRYTDNTTQWQVNIQQTSNKLDKLQAWQLSSEPPQTSSQCTQMQTDKITNKKDRWLWFFCLFRVSPNRLVLKILHDRRQGMTHPAPKSASVCIHHCIIHMASSSIKALEGVHTYRYRLPARWHSTITSRYFSSILTHPSQTVTFSWPILIIMSDSTQPHVPLNLRNHYPTMHCSMPSKAVQSASLHPRTSKCYTKCFVITIIIAKIKIVNQTIK